MTRLKEIFVLLFLLTVIPAALCQWAVLQGQKDIAAMIEAEIPDWNEKVQTLRRSQGNRDFIDESELERDRYWQLTRLQKYLEGTFDQILEDSSNGTAGIYDDVDPICAAHAKYTLQQFLALETFSLHMVDSWGKFPTSGMLSGHTNVPGDFRECIQAKGIFPGDGEIPSGEMRGKYCNTYLLPGEALLSGLVPGNDSDSGNKTIGIQESYDIPAFLEHLLSFTYPYIFPQIGTCFPSSCSTEDVSTILQNFHRLHMRNYTNALVLACQVEEKEPLDAADYTMISVLLIIVMLCAAGTTVDVFSDASNKKAAAMGMKCILAFSVYTNSKKWANTNQGADNLGCLHGLRTLSMAWVVLCHTFSIASLSPIWNMLDTKRIYKDWTMFPLINGTPSVDTFFTMAGILVAYNLLRELDKRKGQFNYLMFVIHRYLRLTPTYIILVGMMATILPYFGSGPWWFSLEGESQGCSKNWWHNILYINNLIKYTDSSPCFGEAWYLANDMQFFLLSPIVIYPLWKWKRIGFSFLAFLNVASMIIPAVITYAKDLPPGINFSIDIKTYWDDVYSKPWARYGPYVLGIVVGYILYERKKNPKTYKLPLSFVLAGWALCTAGALGVIFGPIQYFDPNNSENIYGAWHAILYSGVNRWVWGVCICWIIFACVSGYGGIVNGFLSLKLFVPLGRLTFCMYITSAHIQMIYHFGITHPMEYNNFNFVYIFFAHLVVSGGVSYILTIALESPFIQLEKILFAPLAGPPRETLKPPISNEDINANDLKV